MQKFAYTRKSIAPNRTTNDTWLLRFQAVGKDNSLFKYAMANEWIAASIGWFLGMPVPPYLIGCSKKRQRSAFGSIRFQLNIGPPKLSHRQVFDALPNECAGAIVFDILIANTDRNYSNYGIDNPADPTELYLFDHDRCMFNVTNPNGIEHLESMSGKLAIEGGPFSVRHVFLDEVDSPDRFDPWYERIAEMPPLFLERVCMDTTFLGVPEQDAAAALAFLLDRCKKIDELVSTYKAEFKRIQQWRLHDIPKPDSSSPSISPL